MTGPLTDEQNAARDALSAELVAWINSIVKSAGHFTWALIYDTDPDGIAAGVIAAQAMKQLTGLGPSVAIPLIDRQDPLPEEDRWKCEDKDIDLLVCVDFAPDCDKPLIESLQSLCPVAIIDHHTYEEAEAENVFIIKPQKFNITFDPSQYPASKLVYDVFAPHADLSGVNWLAALGILGDSAYITWPDIVDAECEKLGNQPRDEQGAFQTVIGMATSMISYGEAIGRHTVPKIFDALFEVKSPEDFINNLPSEFRDVATAIDTIVANKDKLGKTEKDVFTIDIDSQYNISSIVSTKISKLYYPDKTVVAWQDLPNGNSKASMRRQDMKKPMNKIAAQIAENIEGAYGGGHIPAAGLTVPKQEKQVAQQLIVNAH